MLGTIIKLLASGADALASWLRGKQSAADRKAGADEVRADSGAKVIKEVRDAKDATADVDGASDADRLRLRDKWTRD